MRLSKFFSGVDLIPTELSAFKISNLNLNQTPLKKINENRSLKEYILYYIFQDVNTGQKLILLVLDFFKSSHWRLQEKTRSLVAPNLLGRESLKETLTSSTHYFSALNWMEREAAEMFGIKFLGKKDTRRLLLDYTTDANPLLKEYPVEGGGEYFYDALNSQVVHLDTPTAQEKDH